MCIDPRGGKENIEGDHTMNAQEKERIFQTLAGGEKRNDNFYVYALCSGNVPFYIGKGRGERILNHETCALMAKESIEADDTLTESEKKYKIDQLNKKLKEILNSVGNQTANWVIVKWGLTEAEALACESALINLLEFTSGKTNPLTNLVNGHASKLEKANPADCKTKARTLDEFLKECAIPVSVLDESVKEKILFLKVNKLYPQCLEPPKGSDKIDNAEIQRRLKDCVSALWHVGKKDRDWKNYYIFALYHQRVVGIFHISKCSGPVGELKSLPEFADFPTDGRKVDRWSIQFASLAEAKKELKEEYDLLEKSLRERNPDPEEALKDVKKRVYFFLDDNVPHQLREKFENTIITRKGRENFFKSQNSLLYWE